ncbi:hypothetical protein FACS189493_5470 [Spirochaetia bacterium]|nr:hypothetical protein FACS189493_5470 [Spirochaetia bacterium]
MAIEGMAAVGGRPPCMDIEWWAIKPAANMQTRDGYGAGAPPVRANKGHD